MKSSKDDRSKNLEKISIYTTLPFILAVPPIVGWFIGQWLDKQCGSKPYMMYALLLCGFIAAGREFYRIIRKLEL